MGSDPVRQGSSFGMFKLLQARLEPSLTSASS